MEQPLVTVVCLCYRHARFVHHAIDSVMAQTYPNIELIVIDDASPDDSVAAIRACLSHQPPITFLPLAQNIGNCAAFNKGLALAKGKYIIDLAADDVLLPHRVARQVSLLEQNTQAAAAFADATIIDEEGNALRTHYQRDRAGVLQQSVPSGNVYQQLFEGYFICSPTLMFRTDVLRDAGGYDEQLAYEDFDVLMRLARHHDLIFQDEVQTQYRTVADSLSKQFYQHKQNKLLASTVLICQKAKLLNRTQAENEALAKFARYHLRQSFLTENFDLVQAFAQLLKDLQLLDVVSKSLLLSSKIRPRVFRFYRFYLQVFKKLI